MESQKVKETYGNPMFRYENNIKVNLGDIKYRDVDSTD
jgi:hypothetical protein